MALLLLVRLQMLMAAKKEGGRGKIKNKKLLLHLIKELN